MLMEIYVYFSTIFLTWTNNYENTGTSQVYAKNNSIDGYA